MIIKRLVLFLLITFGVSNFCVSQEWINSLDAAKRLALIQDKLLFVLWEEATIDPYPVLIKGEKGYVVEYLFENQSLNQIIWERFIPVKLNENNYLKFYNEIKNLRSQNYINKFNDDTIKIMDANGNIINTIIQDEEYIDIIEFINLYALDTSFLKAEIANYNTQKSFYTAYRLASKYIDYAIVVDEKIRPEIIDLSSIYLEEAERFLITEPERSAFSKKCELLKIKQDLVLNKPRKVLRQLKRMDSTQIDETNQSLVDFLYFTSYFILKDEENANVWKSKLSSLNLKKANLIINNNY